MPIYILPLTYTDPKLGLYIKVYADSTAELYQFKRLVGRSEVCYGAAGPFSEHLRVFAVRSDSAKPFVWYARKYFPEVFTATSNDIHELEFAKAGGL